MPRKSEYFYSSKLPNARAIAKFLVDARIKEWPRELAALKRGVAKYGLKRFVYLAIRVKIEAAKRGVSIQTLNYYTVEDFAPIENVLATATNLVYKEQRAKAGEDLQARTVPTLKNEPNQKEKVERLVFHAASPIEKIKRIRQLYD